VQEAGGGEHIVVGHSRALHAVAQGAPVLDHHDRSALQPLVQRVRALLDEGKSHVDDDERDDEDEGVGEGVVVPHHGVLNRLGDDEEEDEVERRDLTQRAVARETEEDEQGSVDADGADDGFRMRLLD
jgi:hypothetical protein